jgi:hypothetical protein
MAGVIFKTDKKESFNSWLKKIFFNFFPAYRRTGGKICFLSDDYKEVHVRLGLNWKTYNYVGSVFGGSIYGAIDPIYMVQLINILGKKYVVWDKAASIKFIKPIRKTVYAKFLISDAILEEIKINVKAENKYILHFTVSFQDEKGIIYAEIIKTLYIADKNYYDARKSPGGLV